MAQGLFSERTLREALYIVDASGADPLQALGLLVPESAREALELARVAAWGDQAGVRQAATQRTDPGPPSPALLEAAVAAARVSSEDPPGVRRWLRGLKDLTEAGTEGLIQDAPGPSAPPRAIGGYRVEGELARGGMGVVYLGHDEALDRPVAVKVLRRADLADDEDLRRFQLEARATAALKHPGIVSVHASGLDAQGNPYLVLELVDGASLCEHLSREGPLEPREAATFAREVAEALAHAHHEGVLHRDLKPANILVDGAGRARLTDFGIAKRVGVEGGLTQTGQVLGTPSYMAPEQADGRSDGSDARTDIYGLGATLFDLLIGRPPFVGVNTWQVLNAVLSEPPPAPHSLRPELDRSLSAICLRCLEKEPERRYPSAQALADDLGRYLAGDPVQARPPSLGRRARRAAHRQRVPLLTVASLACLLLALAFGLAQRQQSVTRRHLERAHRLARLGAPAGEVRAEVEAALAGESSLENSLEGAQALRAAGLDLAADELLERAIAAHPPGIEALLALHQGHLRGGPSRFSEALARALEAARLSAAPEGREAALRDYAQAEALLEEDPAGATALLTRAIERAPRFGWAYVARAAAKESLGDLSGARQDLSRALELDPRNFVALCNRGSILWTQGYPDAARVEFEAACALDPQSDYPRYLLGSLELAEGDHEAARRSLILAASLRGPRAGDSLALIAVCDRALGQPQLARGRAQQALRSGARGLPLAQAHTLLAELSPDEGRALEHLDAALEASPEFVAALVGRGELRASREDLDAALDLAPSHAGALRARAKLSAAAGSYPAARLDLDLALSLDPADAEAYLLRADLALLEGDPQRALRDYENASRARSEWAEPLLRRGVLLARLGRHPEARRDWEQALALLPLAERETRAKVQAWLERLAGD